MLLTVDRYQAITGDKATATGLLPDLIEEATERLEEALDRKLASAERTERMYPTRDGSLWPHAIPITAAPDSYTIDGTRLIGCGPYGLPVWPSIEPGIDVVYTGGWVERTANPTAVNRLPLCIETDLAWAVYNLRCADTTRRQLAVPAGATSVRLGDAAVTYGPGGAVVGAPGEANIVWSKRSLGYRYMRIGGC